MQCPGGLRRAQHGAAQLQNIGVEPVRQQRLCQYLGTGETQVITGFASHIETQGQFTGRAARQQYNARDTGSRTGDSDQCVDIASPWHSVRRAVHTLAIKQQIGTGRHAQRPFPSLQPRLAQQPVGQQRFAHWSRY
ncbi:hypothetical protein D3C81_1461510 [compost metagenome]